MNLRLSQKVNSLASGRMCTATRYLTSLTRQFSRMSALHLEAEKSVAISAVLKASAVATRVQADLIDNEKATKSDNSPVTGALRP